MVNLRIGSNLSKAEVYVLVKRVIDNCKIKSWNKNDNNFNHNTSYKNTLEIVKHGILSIDARNRMDTSKKIIQAVDNVNSYDCISVSKVEAYNPQRDFYYDYDYPINVNFVIDEKIRSIRNVRRNCENYCNEFLIHDSVPIEYINCLQVRLLELINLIGKDYNNVTIDKFIECYNYLIDSISYMIENNIDIPLVEASNDEMYVLDKEKLLSYGKMVK